MSGWPGRWPVITVCAAVIAVSLAGEWRTPLNSDAAWLYYCAVRLLGGERLYSDILEINPPLIVWLNLPLAALGRATGWAPAAILRAAVALAGVASIAASVALLARQPRVTARAQGIAGLALTVAVFPLVGGIFGQREHLALILAIPFVAVAALRAEQVYIHRSVAAATGLAAGIGLGIKPHYVLVWVAILLVRTAWAPRRTRLIGPEDIAVVGVWIAYAVAVAALTPRYFAFAAGSAHDYLKFGAHSLRYILIEDSPAIGWYVAVAGWWLFTPARRTDAIGALAAAAGAGFLAAVVLQHKGWSYHFYPVNALAFLLAAATSASAWPTLTGDLPTRLGRRVAAGIFSTLVVAFAIVVVWVSVDRTRGSLPPRRAEQVALRNAVERIRGVRSSMVLSSQIRDGFPLTLETGLVSHPAYSSLWVPLVYYRSYAGESQRVGYRAPGEMSPGEREAFDRIVHDLVSQRPDLLVVESPSLNERRARYPGGFDFLAYYGQDARFARAASAYTEVDDVGGIRLLRRMGAPAEPR